MDWVTYGSKAMTIMQKYKYVLLVIIAGIVLLRLPDPKKVVQQPNAGIPETGSELSVEESLARILGMIEGAGRVEVMLTQVKGEEILYQTDSRQTTGEHTRDIQSDTVLVSGDDRTETGLIRQRNPPVYQGAIILCQGADNAEICLSIVNAVMGVTGLTSDRITVLKMK